MGQDYKLVNLDKKEFIDGYHLSEGTRIWEWCVNNAGGVLLWLVGKGGGFEGRWAGDRIVLIGDYHETDRLYNEVDGADYKEITFEIKDEYNKFIDYDDDEKMVRARKLSKGQAKDRKEFDDYLIEEDDEKDRWRTFIAKIREV